MSRFDFTALLESELQPALGVTEIGAIALASARAADAADGSPLRIRLTLSGGVYKNAFSCAIPGTRARGCEMAAVLGVLGGDWSLGLECLKNITRDHVKEAKELGIPVEVIVDESKENVYVQADVRTTKALGIVRIEDLHDNITYVAKNDIVIFDGNHASKTESATFDFDAVTVADFVAYVKSVPVWRLDFIKDMIDMNCKLAEEGEKGVGLNVWKTLTAFRKKGELGNDMITEAQRLTCSAMDARLAGLPFPAMGIVGSGSHGILCSLPVVSYGRFSGATEEEIIRAVALSGLITIYSKHYTGRLSALCGCVLGGGSGAAGGIVLLMGGGAREVSAAIDHMAANLTGMICDGGSIGCVLKTSAGVSAAYLSAMLAVKEIEIPHRFGVVGSTVEQTTRNLGRISEEGLSAMDRTIIDIMQKGL